MLFASFIVLIILNILINLTIDPEKLFESLEIKYYEQKSNIDAVTIKKSNLLKTMSTYSNYF